MGLKELGYSTIAIREKVAKAYTFAKQGTGNDSIQKWYTDKHGVNRWKDTNRPVNTKRKRKYSYNRYS